MRAHLLGRSCVASRGSLPSIELLAAPDDERAGNAVALRERRAALEKYGLATNASVSCLALDDDPQRRRLHAPADRPRQSLRQSRSETA